LIWKFFRKYFVTGILVLLPLIITAYIVVFVFNLVDARLRNLIWTYTHYRIPGAGLLTFILLCFLAGVFVQNVVGRQLLRWGEAVLRRIPVVKSIYSASKQVMEVFASDRSEAFQKVVLVEFPRRGSFMLGFLTGVSPASVKQQAEEDLWNVFVPVTPPGHGYLLMLPRSDISILDMSVEEGLKLVLSAGITSSPSYLRTNQDEKPDAGH
jgi:uncharacterized membrane protein